MTKNVFKIGAVVLLICMLGAVGVSSVSAAHSHDETEKAKFGIVPAEHIWQNDGKPYWTFITDLNGEPLMIINATTVDDAAKYLAAYNITIGGNLTDVSMNEVYDFKFVNVIPSFAADSIAQNGWKIASTVTLDGDMIQINNVKKNIANLSLTSSGVEKLSARAYGVKVLDTSELGLAKKNDISIMEIADFAKDNSTGLSEEFAFIVRQDNPEIDSFAIKDYLANLAVGDTVYIYSEHGNVDASITSTTLDLDFDDTDWSVEDVELIKLGANTNVETSELQIVESVAEPWNQKVVTVYVNRDINVDTGNKSKVYDQETFTVNVTNWTRSMTKTADVDSPTGKGEDEGWNFVNALGIEYVVGAAPMLNTEQTAITNLKPWASNVPIEMITPAGASAIAWNPTVKYVPKHADDAEKKFEINGVSNGGILENAGNGANATFKVTTNDIKNGEDAHDVTIKLIGYTKGDADMDNHVDIVDSSIVGVATIRAASETMTELIKTTDENFIYADCNSKAGSGNIDVADVRAINRYLVGLAPWSDGTVVGPQYSVA